MISENFETWLNVLETTDLPQASESLVSRYDDNGDPRPEDAPLGYCCLGVACMIAPNGEPYINTSGEYVLLPVEVADWMGLGPYYPVTNKDYDWERVVRESPYTGSDITIDWKWESSEEAPRNTDPYDTQPTVSWLNDNGCSFAQIAQMVRYFGVREVRL